MILTNAPTSMDLKHTIPAAPDTSNEPANPDTDSGHDPGTGLSRPADNKLLQRSSRYLRILTMNFKNVIARLRKLLS